MAAIRATTTAAAAAVATGSDSDSEQELPLGLAANDDDDRARPAKRRRRLKQRGTDDTEQQPPKEATKKKQQSEPTVIVKAEPTECSVCYDACTRSGRHRLVSLKCGHVFGKKCIERWVAERKSCPNCNESVRRSDIRPLFTDHVAVVDNTGARRHDGQV
ncbi:hypothetical protein PINS_up022421 [Pythium insidiosum]|nr:hypothetical protein PINS_up022421 [Pythium insidiosum]